MTKIASIGECMAEMIQESDGRYRRGYAGDTLNMAQYLAWMDLNKKMDVYYATVFGADKFGHDIINALQQNGIKTDFALTTDRKNTGLYFADVDKSGNRDYTFYRSDSAAKQFFRLPESSAILDRLLTMDMLYASAITLMILDDEDRARLVNLFNQAKAKGITTVFDTNYRPRGWVSHAEAASWITKILPQCSIVLPTLDENHIIFGDITPTDTINRIRQHGVQEIVVKCGADPCAILHEDALGHVPALSGITAIDTTSAGDSFNAGYLAGRLTGLPPEQAAMWGHRLAAQVVQHRGAFIPRDKMPVFAV